MFWSVLMKLAVVVEKPFTVDAKDADHLIKVQKETGKTLTVFQSAFLIHHYFYSNDSDAHLSQTAATTPTFSP